MHGAGVGDQRHAVLAAGDQHGLGVERFAQALGGGGDLVVALRRRVRGVGKLLPVGRDQGGAAVDAVVAALGIDDHRLALRVGGRDHVADDARGERALGVVGQHHRADARHGFEHAGDQLVFARRVDRRGHFPIGAQQMGGKMLGHEAHLARGLARRIDDQFEFDVGMGLERGGERAAGLVVADHADEDAAGAERHQIARDIAGAADHQLAALDRDHRRRRLRRDARDVAIDELVQHQIADAEHGLAGEIREVFVEVEHWLSDTGPGGRDSR